MQDAVITLLVSVLAAVAALNGWMYLQQPAMVFHPLRTLDASPRDRGLAYEDVSLITDDGLVLHGWYVPREGSQRVLLFLHGNAGNISQRGESIEIFHRLGLNVLIVDYRGYGRSEGEPDENGLYRDAQAAWRYLVETRGVPGRQIIVFGRSLGGAVAAHLAAQVQPAGLVLESTLSSARDLAQTIYPLFSHVLVMRYRFDTVASLAQVHCPVLVLHSETDDIIPYRLGEKVYRAAREPRRFVTLHGDHNSGFLQSQPGYQRELGAFIGSLDDAGGS